jgi:AAA domain
MPIAASALEKSTYLRVLLMGAAKCGKTTTSIVSLVNAFGLGYVFVCGDESGLEPAVRRTKKFEYDRIRDENDMETAIKEARKGVKEGRYKWVLVDDFSLYASWLEGALRDASAAANKSGEPDGRRYWPEYKTRLLNIARRLLDVHVHVIFVTHYIEQGSEIEGQRAKSGVGIVPMIGGSAREELPALFKDVVFMEKGKADDSRVFKINPQGVWGPGCRSIDGTKDIPADFGEFLRAMSPTEKKSGSTNHNRGNENEHGQRNTNSR